MAAAITVHPLSSKPTEAWEEISKTQKFAKLGLNSQTKSKFSKSEHIRIVCISDTHSDSKFYKSKLPKGDILVHAGDFTKLGKQDEIIKFNNWIKNLPHKHKIVIAGNHELSFDPHSSRVYKRDDSIQNRTLLTDCTYLEDSSVTLYGLKIYGAPWQPKFGGWAFNLSRGEQLLSKWNLIPDDTDVLVTHGPPLGYGDETASGGRGGCVELLSTIQKRVKPKYHIYGHIHEGYGMTTDGRTVFINAAICDRRNVATNLPIIVDIATKT